MLPAIAAALSEVRDPTDWPASVIRRKLASALSQLRMRRVTTCTAVRKSYRSHENSDTKLNNESSGKLYTALRIIGAVR
jgi:hypothetical protein